MHRREHKVTELILVMNSTNENKDGLLLVGTDGEEFINR